MPKELAPITVEGSAPTTAAPAPASPALVPVSDEAGRVVLTDGAGDTQSFPTENFDAAIAAGYRPATRAEYRSAKDGALGSLGAGVMGAARGASFGLVDPLIIEGRRALDGDAAAEWQRRELAEERDAHPTASMVGEIGGSLLPLALGLPPAGEAAVVGEGLLARAASRFVASAPRLIGEGIAFGEQHQLTEDVLGNHELVAGKYLAAGLEGGLVNLLLGSALHAAGGAAFDKIAARGAAAAGEGIAERGVKKLAGMAEEQAAKGIMPAAGIGASEMSRLGRTIEEQTTRVRQIGRTLLDEGISTPLAGKAVQAERLAARMAKAGEELGAIRKTFEASGLAPDAPTIFSRITNEVVAPVLERPFSDAEYRSIAPYIEEIGERIGKDGSKGISFENLHKLRTALDDKLQKFWKMPVEARPPGLEEVANIRRILESEYEVAADRAAALAGEDTARDYRVAKALYSDLATASGWAKKAAGKEMQHRAISLTDTIAAGAGLATGHGGLAGAALVGNKLMRTYGNQAAAYALNNISKLESLQRAALAFDGKLTASAEAFFGKRAAPPSTAKRVAITPEQRVALRMAAKNPGAFAEHVADALAQQGLHEAAPNVTRAMVLGTVRAAQWVANKLPPEPSRVGASFGPEKPRPIGKRAQLETERALRALDSDAMLDDLANKRLSRQQVEALKFVNPDLFYEMRGALRKYGIENDPSVSIQQQVAMSIAFDTPVSAYTRPATIRGFQQAFNSPPPELASPTGGGQPAGKPIGNGHSKAAEAMASPTDRAAANGAL